VVHQEHTSFVKGRFILDTVVSTWEAMEWARETSQQSLILKIDFDKAYDWVDWSFILEMLTCLGFGPRCVAMVNTLFTNASTFVSINNALSPRGFSCIGPFVKGARWLLICMC
jgi:hypothetical protein